MVLELNFLIDQRLISENLENFRKFNVNALILNEYEFGTGSISFGHLDAISKQSM